MKEKNILVVDYATDRILFFLERFGHQNLDLTDASNDAIRYIMEKLYDYLFLGGELGEYGGTCIDVAEFLYYNKENPNNGSIIIIHSKEIASAGPMIKLLPEAHYFPFSESIFSSMFDI
jgi:hypothetical protein